MSGTSSSFGPLVAIGGGAGGSGGYGQVVSSSAGGSSGGDCNPGGNLVGNPDFHPPPATAGQGYPGSLGFYNTSFLLPNDPFGDQSNGGHGENSNGCGGGGGGAGGPEEWAVRALVAPVLHSRLPLAYMLDSMSLAAVAVAVRWLLILVRGPRSASPSPAPALRLTLLSCLVAAWEDMSPPMMQLREATRHLSAVAEVAVRPVGGRSHRLVATAIKALSSFRFNKRGAVLSR